MGGLLWLAAAALVLAAAVLIAVGAPTWWWVVSLSAAAVSPVTIVSSWSDARAGSVVNIVLVLVAGYGFASLGPTSFHAQWRHQVEQALAEVDPAPAIVNEEALVDLRRLLAALRPSVVDPADRASRDGRAPGLLRW